MFLKNFSFSSVVWVSVTGTRRTRCLPEDDPPLRLGFQGGRTSPRRVTPVVTSVRLHSELRVSPLLRNEDRLG